MHPDHLWKNVGALPGDRLILTKPVGTGILTTALKADFLSGDEGQEVIRVMSWLNKYARDAVADLEIHGCTDITGFGLAGHCLEMAQGSGVTLCIDPLSVPVQKGALEYASMGMVPAGAYRNKEFVKDKCSWGDTAPELIDVLCDPQTSGGLLLAVSEKDSLKAVKRLSSLQFPGAIIGKAIPRKDADLLFMRE